MAEDYTAWSYEDLVAEIRREENLLADERKTLRDVEDTITSIDAEIEAEKLPSARERFLRRQRTIAQLQKGIAERAEDIKRREERIAEREREIIRLQIFRASPYTIRAIRRIISAYQGWQARRSSQQEREERRLKRLEKLQVKEEPLIERLKKLREELDYWRVQAREIRGNVAEEEARLDRKRAALPSLYRIKIRLYNEMEGPNGSPTGMFQAWFDIDAILDPSTRLVRWDWGLTAREIRIAKTHMVGYFKGMAKWASPEDIGQAYLDETLGIPYSGDRATYARKLGFDTYTKGVPSEYIKKAEQMTVEQLVVGESSVEPKPNPKPTAENMGVFFEKVMIIGSDGTIKWQETRNRWVYHPTDDQVKKVKEELRLE